MSTPPVALTIAGSDSGGGAGIQADLKTFAALGVFGTSAITAVTAQNTVAVERVDVLPVEAVDAQIDAVLADLPVTAVKTGMLATAAIVELVSRRAAAGDLPHLVVDPVMVASSGDRLLDQDAETAYRELLFPHAEVITPNLLEASVFVGRPLRSADDALDAAFDLAEALDAWVVVKGGHLPGMAVDAVVHHEEHTVLRSERVDTANVHGTGCSFASATAAGLAAGLDPGAALRQAKAYVDRGLRGGAGWRLGAGHGPIDHFGWDAPA
jgi:hydroxymethylpyrimidine/phosphomethylpyrimidine kinase